MSSPSILVWYQYVASTRTHIRELPFAFCYFLSLGFLSKHQIILKASLFRLTLWTPLAFWSQFQQLIDSRFRREMEFSYRARILQPSVMIRKWKKKKKHHHLRVFFDGRWCLTSVGFIINNNMTFCRNDNAFLTCLIFFLSCELLPCCWWTEGCNSVRVGWAAAEGATSVLRGLLSTHTHVGNILHTHTSKTWEKPEFSS